MKVLIAPDKFKDALEAGAVAAALAAGVRAARPSAQIALCPLADGGEGTGRLLAGAAGFEQRSAPVLDPLGRERLASWWWNEPARAAIIELAEASGLALLAETERAATRTTSYGTGQLLRAAIDAGARRIALCVGGSATVDGGAGCLQALGWGLSDRAGAPLSRPASGGVLEQIAEIRPPQTIPEVNLVVLCDVDHPLLGPRGAAAVFAPQKGASAEQVRQLEKGLANWATVLARCTGRDARGLPGAGAAGGLPAGLAAALAAELTPGFHEVARRLDLRRKLADCDLCLTGEGRIDEQTAGGKVVAGVAELARRIGVAVVAFAGAARPADGHAVEHLAGKIGLREIVVVTPRGTPTKAALAATSENLRAAVARYMKHRP